MVFFAWGSSINYFTVLGGRESRILRQQYQGFSDEKRDDVGGGGVKKCSKCRDVIYGLTLAISWRFLIMTPIAWSHLVGQMRTVSRLLENIGNNAAGVRFKKHSSLILKIFVTLSLKMSSLFEVKSLFKNNMIKN
jgi:hypothetical protein